VARSATVAGGKLDVASPAVGRRAGGDRIHADGVAIRMTTAGYAAGIRGICPGSRYMDRTRIRENMRCSACDIDDTIDVLRGVGESGPRCVDMGMAIDTSRSSNTSMGRDVRRKTVARAAARSRQIVRVTPYR
jgi:hypothetical protein